MTKKYCLFLQFLLYFVSISAGVGRTGVFIVIDRLIDELEKNDVKSLNIFNVVKYLRTRRINMVQSLVSR